MSDLDLILTNNLFREYIKNEYQITFEENDLLLLLVENEYFNFTWLPPIQSNDINTIDDYKEYFHENPTEKKRFDKKIVEFKENIEFAKKKKEGLKIYFIDTYKLYDDHLIGKVLTNIIEKYIIYRKKNLNFKDFFVFLKSSDSEIQTFINKEIKKSKSIERSSKKSKSIEISSKKNKDLYKMVKDMIANKEEMIAHKKEMDADNEEKLNVKINEANNKLEKLSGLNKGEIASVIDDVMIIIKEKINNKTDELELKEKIIYYLNEGKTKHLLNLRDLIH